MFHPFRLLLNRYTVYMIKPGNTEKLCETRLGCSATGYQLTGILSESVKEFQAAQLEILISRASLNSLNS